MEEGQFNARNVAPEMFGALLDAGERYGVPCLAMRWPTDAQGRPVALRRDDAYVDRLKTVLEALATRPPGDDGWSHVGDDVVSAMRTQAGLARRTSDTRIVIDTPIDVESAEWIWDLLPAGYYRSGKAEKIFAYAALAATQRRPLPDGAPANGFWTRPGRAQVAYIGYQWRPDPTTGLIAYSGALAQLAGLPLIVVWPRVFLRDGAARQELLTAWDDLRMGHGTFVGLGWKLGFADEAITRLGDRAQARDRQFGIFAPRSKVGRVIDDVADLVVFGDGIYLPP